MTESIIISEVLRSWISDAGKILAIFREEGDDVPCLENVCVIGNDGEDFSEFIPKAEEDDAPAEEAAPAAEAAE